MNILLCVSKTPDTTAKIVFADDKKNIKTDGVTFILNPYDDHALARAMDIKEKTGATLTIAHVGDASSEQVLRKCLAIGADKVIRVEANPTDAYQVAGYLAQVAQAGAYDLIITGRESIDYNGNQVCEFLGEMLDLPTVSYVTFLDVEGSTIKMKRFIDGGEETLNIEGKAVISATKELAEMRIPNMRGIMAARTKPIEVFNPQPVEALTELVSLEAPAAKSGCTMFTVEEAEKLIETLRTKEKVL